MALACTNPNSSWVDITAVWLRCHPHLQPLAQHLPLELENYAIEGARLTPGIAVLAHIRFGAECWTDEPAVVVYTPADKRFFLAQEYILDFHKSKPSNQLLPVTAVSARLWFAAPTFLNLEPTTKCNFNCWYCIGRHMKQEDISVDNFAAALENFPALKTLALVGEGEPLLHKGFFKMAAMARERGIRVMIISNGSTLSSSVVRQLCEHEIAYIGISIDSSNPETFSNSRIDGNLDQVWRGIERLRKYRDEHHYQYPKIGVKGSLFTATQFDIPDIVAAAKAHGVDVFESFQPLNPMQSYVNIYPRQYHGELGHIDSIAGTIERDSKLAASTLQPITDFCAAESIDIDKNGRPNTLRKNCDEQWIYALLSGDITPCCQIKTPISPSWNLFHHPLATILAEPQYENIRFNLWNGIFPVYCSGCWKTRS